MKHVRKKEKDDLEEKRFQRENERRKLQGLTLLKKGEKPTDDSKDDPILDETGQDFSRPYSINCWLIKIIQNN